MAHLGSMTMPFQHMTCSKKKLLERKMPSPAPTSMKLFKNNHPFAHNYAPSFSQHILACIVTHVQHTHELSSFSLRK